MPQDIQVWFRCVIRFKDPVQVSSARWLLVVVTRSSGDGVIVEGCWWWWVLSHHVGHVGQRADDGAGGKVGVNIVSKVLDWFHRPGFCFGVVQAPTPLSVAHRSRSARNSWVCL